jgi:hypothetical protein
MKEDVLKSKGPLFIVTVFFNVGRDEREDPGKDGKKK